MSMNQKRITLFENDLRKAFAVEDLYIEDESHCMLDMQAQRVAEATSS